MADVKVQKPEQTGQRREELDRSSQEGRIARRAGYYPFGSEFGGLFSASPFSLMRRMSEEMDRMFNQPFGHGESSQFWSPAIEVSEREGNLVVCAELPGLKQEDIKVEVVEDALHIQGERKSEHDESKGGLHRSERHYGSFYRTIPLPQGAKTENAKAEFRDGVLEVRIPMEESTRRRQIPIGEGRAGGAIPEKK